MSERTKLQSLALAILAHGEGLNRRSGQFLGQLVGDPYPLTEKQHAWLAKLAERAGMTEHMEGISHV